MAAIENEHSYAIQLRESANDGSDFSNADADYRVVFLGEDGELHKKDSAGAVTAFAGSGIASTIVDAKGDLIGASAADTPAVVTAGANGTLLIADSTQAVGLRYGSREIVYDFLTADETGKTDATLTNTGLSFAVLNGIYYRFRFELIWRTNLASVGLKVGLTFPTVTRFAGEASMSIGTAGGATNGEWHGPITASGGAVTLTSVAAADTDYWAIVSGLILPSADGTLMLQYAAETTGATVTLRQASMGEIVALG